MTLLSGSTAAMLCCAGVPMSTELGTILTNAYCKAGVSAAASGGLQHAERVLQSMLVGHLAGSHGISDGCLPHRCRLTMLLLWSCQD